MKVCDGISFHKVADGAWKAELSFAKKLLGGMKDNEKLLYMLAQGDSAWTLLEQWHPSHHLTTLKPFFGGIGDVREVALDDFAKGMSYLAKFSDVVGKIENPMVQQVAKLFGQLGQLALAGHALPRALGMAAAHAKLGLASEAWSSDTDCVTPDDIAQLKAWWRSQPPHLKKALHNLPPYEYLRGEIARLDKAEEEQRLAKEAEERRVKAAEEDRLAEATKQAGAAPEAPKLADGTKAARDAPEKVVGAPDQKRKRPDPVGEQDADGKQKPDDASQTGKNKKKENKEEKEKKDKKEKNQKKEKKEKEKEDPDAKKRRLARAQDFQIGEKVVISFQINAALYDGKSAEVVRVMEKVCLVKVLDGPKSGESRTFPKGMLTKASSESQQVSDGPPKDADDLFSGDSDLEKFA